MVYNSIKNVLSSTNQADIISGRDGNLAKTITENIGDAMDSYGTVSYTHLDVYKRQGHKR